MSRSVLQDWVMDLPLREQGVLVVGTRGCDEVPKLPLDSPPRQLTGFLRYLVLVPADEREVGIAGAFFQSSHPAGWKPSDLGHLPVHWYAHIMHAYQVAGYRHPDRTLAIQARAIYFALVDGLHLRPEYMTDMLTRLSEDRIANGTVVS